MVSKKIITIVIIIIYIRNCAKQSNIFEGVIEQCWKNNADVQKVPWSTRNPWKNDVHANEENEKKYANGKRLHKRRMLKQKNHRFEIYRKYQHFYKKRRWRKNEWMKNNNPKIKYKCMYSFIFHKFYEININTSFPYKKQEWIKYILFYMK